MSSPQGARGSSISAPSPHVTCALRRPRAGREAGRKGHISSLCTQLPSQTAPEGLILALSALALSLLAKIFSCTTKKCFVPALLGASQRPSKDGVSIIQSWKYIKDSNLDGMVSSLLAILGKYALSIPLPKPQGGQCGCLLFFSCFMKLLMAAHSQVSLLLLAGTCKSLSPFLPNKAHSFPHVWVLFSLLRCPGKCLH